jgi:nucleotide-binding universal stress UspA family protein
MSLVHTISDYCRRSCRSPSEAARAVNDALPILEKARAVAVVTVALKTDDADKAGRDPAAIVSHLGQHGIRATVTHLSGVAKTVADSLLTNAARTRADLLVMGEYGHSHLLEVALGGPPEQYCIT